MPQLRSHVDPDPWACPICWTEAVDAWEQVVQEERQVTLPQPAHDQDKVFTRNGRRVARKGRARVRQKKGELHPVADKKVQAMVLDHEQRRNASGRYKRMYLTIPAPTGAATWQINYGEWLTAARIDK